MLRVDPTLFNPFVPKSCIPCAAAESLDNSLLLNVILQTATYRLQL